MPSVHPNYEYDIFISYRHNDNRSGWVTDFVAALKVELAATIKEPVSVYFDSNPYDGLLETHNVDKSLEGKLKALILIPIISQTYCDLKSFAWQQEFCVFNQLTKEDQFGRDIKLNNGNVASRILPVKIHDLEEEDKKIIETEIGGVLRSVEFIFKSSGVNRPLQTDDRREDNINKTFYRDQINKVANALKEITYGIRFPDRIEVKEVKETTPESETKVEKTVIQEVHNKSIAVLPFRNLAHDPSQEYFADGITENILMELGSLGDLRVISRTSVMRYKNTTKSAPEIAIELGVKYILEGSAQAHGNKVRINAQLIDANKDVTIWSKVFVESLDDIFEIQNNVSAIVAKELHSSLGKDKKEKISEVPTKNVEAYDLFLKGRHAFNQWGVDGYKAASEYFKQAIALDPEFKMAYSYLASSYSARMSWNGDLSPEEALKHINPYLNEAWKRGPSDNDYLTKAFIALFIDKDFEASEKFLLQASAINPNNATILYTYSYVLQIMGRFDEALELVARAKLIEPLTVAYYNYQSLILYLMGRNEEAISTLKEALKLYPTVIRLYDFLARIYLTLGRFDETIEAIKSGFSSSNIRPPSMVAYLAAGYFGLNQHKKANALLNELIDRSHANEKGVNIYIVHIFNAMGDVANANLWLANAKQTNDVDLIWWQVDPLLKNMREQQNQEQKQPDFEAAEKHIVALLEEQMPNLPYHNINHIYDVLDAALVIAESEKISTDEIKILRLAVLFHDAGFTKAATNHEATGAAMAKEMLPAFGLNQEQIDQINQMILATRIPQSPTSKLDRVLCDADLDYLGREDFYEIGRKLFEELSEQGVVETEREWNLVQKTFLESHRFHTDYSKINRLPTKQKRLQEISDKLKNRS